MPMQHSVWGFPHQIHDLHPIPLIPQKLQVWGTT
jgi:hypothetical protein